jgi:hypothetical protein
MLSRQTKVLMKISILPIISMLDIAKLLVYEL